MCTIHPRGVRLNVNLTVSVNVNVRCTVTGTPLAFLTDDERMARSLGDALLDFFPERRWIIDAECRARGLGTDFYYTRREDHAATDTARKACMACPVWTECLTYGMRERFGVWGGYIEREKRTIRRGMKSGLTIEAAAAVVDAKKGYARTPELSVQIPLAA